MSLYEQIGNFASVLTNLDNEYRQIQDELDKCDNETQDLLHLLEFSDSNCFVDLDITKRLRACRQRRRELKNKLQTLQPLYNFYCKGDNRRLGNQLANIAGETHKIADRHEGAYYLPKAIGDDYKKLEKELGIHG